jgi:hypothetical protein
MERIASPVSDASNTAAGIFLFILPLLYHVNSGPFASATALRTGSIGRAYGFFCMLSTVAAYAVTTIHNFLESGVLGKFRHNLAFFSD